MTLGFGVFYWEDIRHAKHKLFDTAENILEDDSKETSRSPNLLEKEASGREGRERSDRPISIPSQRKAAEPGFTRLFRRHSQRADADDIENRAATSRIQNTQLYVLIDMVYMNFESCF